ncbi:MAG: hypothetical protein UDG94_10305 [Peptococcaceae bacterium]|nr:hypothetical protein [Peptococcaceae bacterium]
MLNYIRSELYRATHTRPCYVMTVVLVLGILAFNLVLHFWGSGADYYGHTSFSYIFSISEPWLYIACGAVVAALLYEGRSKNGNLKNSLASGLSRSQLFIGQCLAALLIATVMLVITLTVWIGSAELLLVHTDTWTISDLLHATALTYPLAVASLISILPFFLLFRRDLTAIVGWLMIWNGVPALFAILGLKFTWASHLASWLPRTFLNFESVTRWWEDPVIIEKALVSGVVGILVFGFFGVVSWRKRDLN